MRRRIEKPWRWLAAPLCALALGACDLTGYDEDISGFYSYAGNVYNSPGYSVIGDIYIDHRSRRTAYADIEWFMLEGTRTILEVEDNNVPVTIDSDGRIRFDVVGDMQLSDGGWTDFRLEHEGRVGSRTMRGSWELITDLPSTDRGSFTASR